MDEDFYNEIIQGGGSGGGSSSGSRWTGHADVEGLKAIGWTDEDIAYYQDNGINWNEEDDQYHKVPEDNVALYGVLTASNISDYKDRIVYLPNIDTSSVTSMKEMFYWCSSMVAIPQLDTSNVTNMYHVFYGCKALVSIPLLNTSNVSNMEGMFQYCASLVSIPPFDISKASSIQYMFADCNSLVSIPQLNASIAGNAYNMFSSCYSLATIPLLNISSVLGTSNMFGGTSIRTVMLKGLKTSLSIQSTSLLTKESLLYIINNESATSAITITLSSYIYDKYVNDADIVAALANHPNISIAK